MFRDKDESFSGHMYNLLWNLSMNKWKQFTLTHYILKQLMLSCSVKQDMFLTKQELKFGLKVTQKLHLASDQFASEVVTVWA